jgi:hypothetical protein
VPFMPQRQPLAAYAGLPYQTVAERWPLFRERMEESGGLPKFVVREFENDGHAPRLLRTARTGEPRRMCPHVRTCADRSRTDRARFVHRTRGPRGACRAEIQPKRRVALSTLAREDLLLVNGRSERPVACALHWPSLE